jgi:hypothetical protein
MNQGTPTRHSARLMVGHSDDMTNDAVQATPDAVANDNDDSDDNNDEIDNLKKKDNLPGFIVKLYEIFNSKQWTKYVGWSEDGESIIVLDINEFTKFVIPNFFNHANFPSFARQLNMYAFRKTKLDPLDGEFKHPYFLKGRHDLLPSIKRKVAGSKRNRKGKDDEEDIDDVEIEKKPKLKSVKSRELDPENEENDMILDDSYIPVTTFSHQLDDGFLNNFDTDDAVLVDESSAVLQELAEQRYIRENFEKRMTNLESRSKQLSNENIALKKIVVESQNKQSAMQAKMEKVLKLLKVICVAGSSSGLLSLKDVDVSTPRELLSIGSPRSVDSNGSQFLTKVSSLGDDNSSNICEYLQISNPFVPPKAELVDDAKLGVQLSRRMNSFDIAAAGIAPPTTSIDKDGSLLKRFNSLEYDWSPADTDNSKKVAIPLKEDMETLMSDQNKTMSRLDSLESTIATFLHQDSIDVDSLVGKLLNQSSKN